MSLSQPRRFHLCGGYALRLGTQHLVSHSEFGISHQNRWRDRLSMYLRCRVGMGRPMLLCLALSVIAAGCCTEGWPQLCFDGKTHLMNFTVGACTSAEGDSELRLLAASKVAVSVMPSLSSRASRQIPARFAYDQKPYGYDARENWDSRKVAVNCRQCKRSPPKYSLRWTPRELEFKYPSQQQLGGRARHSGCPYQSRFRVVDDKPIRASRRSAEGALKGVNHAGVKNPPAFHPAEIGEAKEPTTTHVQCTSN